MSRLQHYSNVLNHIKIIFLCQCSSLLGSPDIPQETDTKLHFSIAFSLSDLEILRVFVPSDI